MPATSNTTHTASEKMNPTPKRRARRKGERPPYHKWEHDDVDFIDRMRGEGIKWREIGDFYGVSTQAVRTWHFQNK